MRTLPTLPDAVSTPAEDSGLGALCTARGCLPLAALDVRARLDGLLARTVIRQTFVNAHAEPLEATYIFPLPDRAAVSAFRLEVAGRVVEGVLQERGAARRAYDQAVRDGHRAALTEEERPGVFTMRVGNLPPGEEATVQLTLAGPLPYAAGEATYRFPLVVAPRYIPGVPLPGPGVGDGVAADTDAVPDASRISPPVLLPGFPNPVRLSLTVEVPGSDLGPTGFRSSLHAVLYEEADAVRRIHLQPGERLDRDFILRFRLGDTGIRSALTLQADAEGPEGTFLLTLMPPIGEGRERARDVVFVLDRSGSMEGWKIVAARRALADMVDTLTEADRFAVLAFDNQVETPGGGPARLKPADDRHRYRAIEFLSGVTARGGTEMARPLEEAVGLLADATAGRERLIVLVTDGQVGNEDQLLRLLGPRLKGIRVFTLGIDQAVNAAFLRRLADLGGGASELVESEERLDEVMDHVHRLIATPVLTGLRLEGHGLEVMPGSVVPSRLPDLFAGAPLLLLGRYRGQPAGALVVRATDPAGQPWCAEVASRPTAESAVASAWARARLRELEDRYVVGTGDRAGLQRDIVATSLRFGVLCRFTAFLAVDRSAVVNPGGQVHSIVQPVEQPSGWEEPEQLRALGVRYSSPPAPCASPPVPQVPPPARMRQSPPVKARASSAPPPARVVPPPKRSAGWIQRLLGLLGRRKKGQSPDATLAGFDRSRYRSRVEALAEALRTAPPDAAGRLPILRVVLLSLQGLFGDLASAGDRHPSVRVLGEVLLKLEALLAERQPDEQAVQDLWAQLEAALANWLAADPAPAPPPDRGEAFWK